jgi:hypothetical protein
MQVQLSILDSAKTAKAAWRCGSLGFCSSYPKSRATFWEELMKSNGGLKLVVL